MLIKRYEVFLNFILFSLYDFGSSSGSIRQKMFLRSEEFAILNSRIDNEMKFKEGDNRLCGNRLPSVSDDG